MMQQVCISLTSQEILINAAQTLPEITSPGQVFPAK
jgi:hypothetical protein